MTPLSHSGISLALEGQLSSRRVHSVALTIKAQRQIAGLLTVSLTAYIIGQPLVTFCHITGIGRDGGYHLRTHALVYGIPLVLAWLSSLFLKRRPARFPGSAFVDFFALVMFAYWTCQVIHGYIIGNDFKYWASTSFNFHIPVLVYFSMRKLDDPPLIDALLRRIMLICVYAVIPNLLVTLYATADLNFVGAGAVTHLLLVVVGTILASRGNIALGTAVILGATVTIIASLKRAIWGGFILLPIVFMICSKKYSKRLPQILLVLFITGATLSMARGRLPSSLNVETLINRVYSIQSETDGFTTGRSRQDEVASIWLAVVTDGTLTSTFFGHGLGATYTYYMESTYGWLIEDHHDAHFTPIGWMLRGGLLGLAINSLFYVAAALACIRCARMSSDSDAALWMGTFTAYFIVAIFVSMFSFSLTPNPATHVIMMMVFIKHAADHKTTPGAKGFQRA